MAIKTIETKAVISAQDQTGATFSAVAQKLRQMEERAASAGKRLASTTKAVETARAASGKAAGASQIAGITGGVVTAIIASESIRLLAEAIGARIHEAVRMETAGFKPEEIEESKRLAARLSTKYPSVSQTALMHMFRNVVATTGDVEEAKTAVEGLAPLRVVAQAARQGQSVEEDFDVLMKGMEIKGVTQKPKEFKEYMEGIAKGLNAFGDTLRPLDYYEMIKYGRQASAGLSTSYMLQVAPTLAQEMKGMSAGQSIAAVSQALIGNTMKHTAMLRFAELGLIDKDDLDTLKTGEVKGLKRGRHVQGWQLAQSDPYAWVQQYLLPAFTKAGITKKEDILGQTPQLFQKGTAAQAIGIYATQQTRIQKDIERLRLAKGLEAAGIYGAKDLGVQVQGFKNAVGNATATLGERLIVNTGALNSVTDGLNRMNERMVNAKPGEGQDKFNRVMNTIFAPDPAGYAAAKRQATSLGNAVVNAKPGEGQEKVILFAPDQAGYRQATSLGNAVVRLDKARAEAQAARRRFDETSYFHPPDKLRAIWPLLEATKEERSARQAYIDARPLGDVSPDLLRRGELYPRKGLSPGILSPMPFEKAATTKIEGSARVGVDLKIDLADGFVLRETRKDSSGSGDVGVSMPP